MIRKQQRLTLIGGALGLASLLRDHSPARPTWVAQRQLASLHRDRSPARPTWGEGWYMPKTPCLLAPAADRNALATPTAGAIALAGPMPGATVHIGKADLC